MYRLYSGSISPAVSRRRRRPGVRLSSRSCTFGSSASFFGATSNGECLDLESTQRHMLIGLPDQSRSGGSAHKLVAS